MATGRRRRTTPYEGDHDNPPMSFIRNVDFDAAMVHANMHDWGAAFAMGAGMSPDEWLHRTQWLSKQPAAYVRRVVAAVQELEES